MGIHQLKTSLGNPTPAQQPVRLLSEKEVALRLNVSISAIRRWRYGRIGPKYVRIGGIIRYRSADIEDFITRHTIGEVR